MKIIDNIKQGTPEWRKLRAGKFTGSNIFKLCAPKGFGDQGKNYIYEVAATSETGEPNDEISGIFAMERGKELEESARCIFEHKFSVEIKQAAAFIPDWTNDCMVSPDGYFRIEEKGFFGNEFKCPENQGIHKRYSFIKNGNDLKDEEPKYYWQIQIALLVSEFENWFFSSYHPKFSIEKLFHTVKIDRNEADILFLKNRILQAIELKNKILKGEKI